MSLSYQITAADGISALLTVPFPYIAKSHVHVYQNGVEVPAGSLVWSSSSVIQLPSVPVAGTTQTVRRQTPNAAPLVTFVAGPLSHLDLNNNALQDIYMAQEASDGTTDALGLSLDGSTFTARTLRVVNVANPSSAQDVASKAYVDAKATTVTGTVPAKWYDVTKYGAAANMLGVIDSAIGIQAACNAASLYGGAVYIPEGFFGLNSPIVLTRPVKIIGAGRGADNVGSGGTVLRVMSDSFDAITGKCKGAFTFADFSMDTYGLGAPPTHHYSAIVLTGDGTSGIPYNAGSEIRNLEIDRFATGIRIESALNYKIDHCRIMDSVLEGIWLSGEGWAGSTGDDCTGDSQIVNNTIWGLNIATGTAIRYNNGGSVFVNNNKLLNCAFGVRVTLLRGPTGTLIVTGNSMEELVKAVTIEQVTSGINFGHVVIGNNQFLTLASTPQNHVYVGPGTAGAGGNRWVLGITITGNIFRAPGGCTYGCVDIEDGQGGIITGNVFDLGSIGLPAININANAKQIVVGPNAYTNVPGGGPIGTIGAGSTRFEDSINLANSLGFAQAYGTVGANGHTDHTFTVPLAAVGDMVLVSLQGGLVDGLSYQAWVSSTGVVTLRVYNYTAGGLAAGTLNGNLTTRRL